MPPPPVWVRPSWPEAGKLQAIHFELFKTPMFNCSFPFFRFLIKASSEIFWFAFNSNSNFEGGKVFGVCEREHLLLSFLWWGCNPRRQWTMNPANLRKNIQRPLCRDWLFGVSTVVVILGFPTKGFTLSFSVSKAVSKGQKLAAFHLVGNDSLKIYIKVSQLSILHTLVSRVLVFWEVKTKWYNLKPLSNKRRVREGEKKQTSVKRFKGQQSRSQKKE